MSPSHYQVPWHAKGKSTVIEYVNNNILLLGHKTNSLAFPGFSLDAVSKQVRQQAKTAAHSTNLDGPSRDSKTQAEG
jgi:hypothetical protein